jgi:hypothetical protein
MKSFLQFLMLIALTLFLTVGGAYAIRHNGLPDLLAEWFPSQFDPDYNKPRPEQTLVAPFAHGNPNFDTQKADDDNALHIPFTPVEGESQDKQLNLPHRTRKEISNWLVSRVSDILNVGFDDYSAHMQVLRTVMTDYALKDYDNFMRNSNILGTLGQDQLVLQSYVEEDPILLNSGEADGRYHWLYEMPVTLSFLPKAMGDYRNIKGQKIPNEYIILKAQVGRVPDTGDIGSSSRDGILIETWEVRRNRKDEKAAPSPVQTGEPVPPRPPSPDGAPSGGLLGPGFGSP